MFICAAACARLAAFDASECGFSPDASGKDNTAALQRAFDRGGYEIPPTPEGKDCLKRFLARPKVLTFHDGIDLTNPNYP